MRLWRRRVTTSSKENKAYKDVNKFTLQSDRQIEDNAPDKNVVPRQDD